jgi:hypothetical protein
MPAVSAASGANNNVTLIISGLAETFKTSFIFPKIGGAIPYPITLTVKKYKPTAKPRKYGPAMSFTSAAAGPSHDNVNARRMVIQIICKESIDVFNKINQTGIHKNAIMLVNCSRPPIRFALNLSANHPPRIVPGSPPINVPIPINKPISDIAIFCVLTKNVGIQIETLLADTAKKAYPTKM